MLNKMRILTGLILFASLNTYADSTPVELKKLEKSVEISITDKDTELNGLWIKMKVSIYSTENQTYEELIAFKLCDFEKCENIGHEINLDEDLDVPSGPSDQAENTFISSFAVMIGTNSAIIVCGWAKRCNNALQAVIQKWFAGDSRAFMMGTFLGQAAGGLGAGYLMTTKDTTQLKHFLRTYPTYLIQDGSFHIEVKSIDDFVEQLSALQIEIKDFAERMAAFKKANP